MGLGIRDSYIKRRRKWKFIIIFMQIRQKLHWIAG